MFSFFSRSTNIFEWYLTEKSKFVQIQNITCIEDFVFGNQAWLQIWAKIKKMPTNRFLKIVAHSPFIILVTTLGPWPWISSPLRRNILPERCKYFCDLTYFMRRKTTNKDHLHCRFRFERACKDFEPVPSQGPHSSLNRGSPCPHSPRLYLPLRRVFYVRAHTVE